MTTLTLQSQASDLHTLKLALFDAIENAEARLDWESASIYNNLLEKGVTPLLKEALIL